MEYNCIVGTSIIGVSAALAMTDSEEHSKPNGMHWGHHRYQAYRIALSAQTVLGEVHHARTKLCECMMRE
jgi:hypothetical protein